MKNDVRLNSLDAVFAKLDATRQAQFADEQMLAQLEAQGDIPGAAATLVRMANACTRLGENKQALQHLQHAQSLYRLAGDTIGVATTTHRIGILYAFLGEKKQALRCYDEALRYHVNAGNSAGVAAVYGSLGALSLSANELTHACQFLKQALAVYRKVGDARGEAGALHTLGFTAAAAGEEVRAMEYYFQALNLRHEVVQSHDSGASDKSDEAATLNSLAERFAERGELGIARRYVMAALALCREAGDASGELAGRHNLAMLAITQGNLIEAKQELTMALTIGELIHHPDLEELRAKLDDLQARQHKPRPTRHVRPPHRIAA